VIAASVALSCACGGDSLGGDQLHGALVNRQFVSESVEGWELVPSTEVRLTFFQDELRAGAGCNSMDGPYQIDGTTLKMLGLGSTDMGCGPGLSAQDQWLSEFLLARPSLELAEPRLSMSTPNARITLLDRELASPDRPLVGTSWTGEALSDGEVAMGGPGMAQVSAWFDASGSVEVHTSCQVGVGTFHVEGTTLTFEGFAYDGAACADSGQQFISDRALLVLNGDPVTFEIEEARLEISQGNNSVSFRAND